MIRKSTRRDFIKHSSAIGAAIWVGGSTAWSAEKSPNSRVRYACIGVDGKGSSDSGDAANHGDIVAIVDIDRRNLAKRKADPKFANAEQFNDYRELFDKFIDKFDAVTVSTPDHNHFLATALAITNGKAAFTQKPLTHSVWEARELARLAKEHDVPTSMGNQGTAEPTLRKSAAILKGGHLGAIKEVHVVTNRPVWAQGGPRPEPADVPKYLNWDAWLGPAPERPYADDAYHKFSWRGWWDFGTGALGDMACHTFNMPFMGAGLRDPISIQAWTSGHNRDSYPQKSKIKFEFTLTEGGPIVPVWWYDGKNEPDEALLNGQKFVRNNKNETTGSVIVCEKGVLYSHGDYAGSEPILISPTGELLPVPDVDFEAAPTGGHFTEFHQSVTGERKRATANFENYAGPLTETILLGNLAVWAADFGEGKKIEHADSTVEYEGKKIEWDAASLAATNAPEVMNVVKREYRQGWTL